MLACAFAQNYIWDRTLRKVRVKYSLSTGAVAALAARLAYPAHIPVVAVGFTGKCSFLNKFGEESNECAFLHNFTYERNLLTTAGILFEYPPMLERTEPS